MKPEQFAYWLQGFVEISGEMPTKEQWDMIKEHLQLVFDKKTTDPTKTYPKEILEKTATFPSVWSGTWATPLHEDNPKFKVVTC